MRKQHMWQVFSDLIQSSACSNCNILVNVRHAYRRFAWTESRRRITPLDSPPAIGDASVHGDCHWDQNSTVFTVKLKGGGSSIEVRSENAIVVTQKLALSFNDFFDST
jgi:hypothetical protein